MTPTIICLNNKIAKKTPITIILDNVRSALNVGSVFRTSDAFLIEKIYLCGITAKPPHKDIQKTVSLICCFVYSSYTII